MSNLGTALIVAFVATGAVSARDEIPRDDAGRYAYRGVVQIDANAETLYERALAWARSTWPAQRVELEDPARARIGIRGAIDAGKQRSISYRLLIETRDGRYRFILTDLLGIDYRKALGGQQWPLERVVGQRPLFDAVADNAPGLLDSLESAMRDGAGDPAPEPDW